MEHLRFSQIVDIAEGRSALDAQPHVAACPACANDLAWLRWVIGLMHEMRDEQAPAAALGKVKALFRERRGAPGPADLLPALLRFDSQRDAPVFGLRSGGTGERQLLLSAANYELDLRIAPADSRWVVSGQILDHPELSGTAELMGGAAFVSGPLSRLNEFTLPPVPAGRYNLTLIMDRQALVALDLEIGS